jgi:hypothetical protein
LDGDSASGEQSFDALFALTVASYRDELKDNAVCQLVLDILWGAWSGIYDEEMESLASQDLQGNSKTFLWHRYCSEGSTELGVKYRAMLAASAKGPISMQPLAQIEMAIGASELDDKAKAEVKEVQELLMSLRRKTVNFASLPAIGGAAGGDFSTAQLQKVWESLRVGHKYSHMKTRVRAFVFCADMFPPNLVKPSASGGSLVDQITPDADRMKRVIDFITQKRLKDDIVLLFDGRSRACRKIIENAEEKLAASGAHQVAECWYVYVVPEKKADPRVPGRQTSFNSNNTEVAMCSLQKRGVTKVTARAEYNVCGESSTSSTTYTGVPMRQFRELPRMDYDTKSTILGVTASGVNPRKRMQKDTEKHGHPFSHFEVKPIGLWQRLSEHFGITHIVDFTPGSAALAIAASGAAEYDGIAVNDAHRDWLDSICDRCVMYMAGRDREFSKGLYDEPDFVDKVEKYFGGTMMEARKLMEPVDDDDKDDSDSGSGGEDE